MYDGRPPVRSHLLLAGRHVVQVTHNRERKALEASGAAGPFGAYVLIARGQSGKAFDEMPDRTHFPGYEK